MSICSEQLFLLFCSVNTMQVILFLVIPSQLCITSSCLLSGCMTWVQVTLLKAPVMPREPNTSIWNLTSSNHNYPFKKISLRDCIAGLRCDCSKRALKPRGYQACTLQVWSWWCPLQQGRVHAWEWTTVEKSRVGDGVLATLDIIQASGSSQAWDLLQKPIHSFCLSKT